MKGLTPTSKLRGRRKLPAGSKISTKGKRSRFPGPRCARVYTRRSSLPRMAAVRVELALEAAEEIQAAKDWYAERSAAAALSFADEVSAAIERIRESPDRWPE